MGENYRQLSLEQRCAIARLHGNGQSYRKIAASLDRAALERIMPLLIYAEAVMAMCRSPAMLAIAHLALKRQA